MLTNIYKVYFFLVLTALIQKAYAWGNEAHQAAAMVAVSGLTPQASLVSKHMLAPHDLIDASFWAHQVERSFPESSKLHYLLSSKNITPCGSSIHIDQTNCPDNMCLVRAVQIFYKKLKGVETPDLRCFNQIKVTDSDALRFFVSLLADLHEPLRLGFQEDLGGKNLPLYYWNTSSIKTKTSLFDFIETHLVEKFIAQRPNFWYSGWTHVNTLSSEELSAIEKEWKSASEEERLGLFEKWANESFSVACDHLYKPLLSKDPRASPEPLYPLEERHFFMILRRQLLIAGARTAIILNSILGDLGRTKLRHSSGFHLKSN